jgi:hypothetical protein
MTFIQALASMDGDEGPVLFASGSGSAVFQREGSAWEVLSGAGIIAEVRALAVFDDGNGPALYSTPEGGILPEGAVTGVVRWTGEGWVNLGSGLGGTSLGLCLTTFDDGAGEALYVGGQFQSAGGLPALNVASWDGAAWSNVGMFDEAAPVQELIVFDDGTGPALYAGANDLTIDGVTSNVARWDGKSWTLLPEAPTGGVRALVVHDDGTGPALYAGGLGASPSPPVVARFDGEAWSVVGEPFNGSISDLASFDDGSGTMLYASGSFTNGAGDGLELPRIARFEDGAWTGVGGGTSGNVDVMLPVELAEGPALLVGGFFSTVGNGVGSSSVGLWQGCAAPVECVGDLDESGGVDSGDLNLVLGGFGCVGQGCAGDVDGDGDTDSADLNAVLAAFGGVCP